jgi:tetratricopeptide (TPR) repeat protein
MMGRAYQDNKLAGEAVACFEKGIERAEEALAIQADSGAYEMLAANIGQVCMLKPVPWVMANGLRVEQNAKKALALNPRSAAANYLIASRWVFGPGLLGNPKKGIAEMEAILNNSEDLQKDEFFNVYSAIGYGYIQLKKHQDALPWVQKSLAIYPSNKFAGDLLSQIQQAGR